MKKSFLAMLALLLVMLSAVGLVSCGKGVEYKVEYYLQDIDNSYPEDPNYVDVLTGETGAVAVAERKSFDHFTFNETKSIMMGNIKDDGSLVLKVYYIRDSYNISINNTNYGKAENSGYYKFGETLVVKAIPNRGCEFLGWYSGDDLVSTDASYNYTVDKKLQARFSPKAEMADFEFSSSTTHCKITGIKDKTATKVIIPNCVTSIGDYAFKGCTNLTSVTILDGATSIGNSAFYGCTSLTSVTIPNSVTSIGNSAFGGCTNLTNMTIPNSVIIIGDYAFKGCTDLTSVTIPNSVTRIGFDAFKDCHNLTIYCEAAQKPSDWYYSWNCSNCKVVWDYKNK